MAFVAVVYFEDAQYPHACQSLLSREIANLIQWILLSQLAFSRSLWNVVSES
jgi:hypothetical protein